MRAHIIQDGIVTNTIEVDDLSFMPGLVDASAGGSIGDRYEAGTFVPPDSKVSVKDHNAPILAALKEIDLKSIRPLRDGDAEIVSALAAEAAALRLQLRKG